MLSHLSEVIQISSFSHIIEALSQKNRKPHLTMKPGGANHLPIGGYISQTLPQRMAQGASMIRDTY